MSRALSRIIQSGFTLQADGEDLIIEPFSKLTPEQLAFLRSHKTEIIQELKQQQAANDNHDPFDDRHYCLECQKLINGRCFAQRFRPVDDVPRRCPDFNAA